ncbi:hypothetical protein BBF96_12750 [Anoxybacter fermentans]|uniref:Sulphur transport domain-containing protein n=1 Tax=Anoxybacter fermentans TaxID=1323375 RepID=A0A3S9T0X1_9FIRM|nr:YedE family putative selenium transporter [Anoxybacter fermentans]AZR74189.1 hypothetical protein BBF96_12750 [Anoxybacter fermentans]
MILLIVKPAFIAFSQAGPGSLSAPILLSLFVGLIVGFLVQSTGFCFTGGYRNLIFGKNPHLFQGYPMTFVTALFFNLIFGQFKLGFANQPAAHSDYLWSFLSMTLVGICATFASDYPLRQLIKSTEGNLDSVITVFGMILGTAFAHNFGLASSGKGTTANGQIAVIIGLVTVLVIGYFCKKLILSDIEIFRQIILARFPTK